MSFKITFNGGKRDEVRKAVTEQSDANIKNQTQSEESKTQALKLIDALPDNANITGTIEDHNNGTLVMNVTARTDFAAVAESSAATVTGGKSTARPGGGPMPGAGAAGRPELTPSGSQANSSGTAAVDKSKEGMGQQNK